MKAIDVVVVGFLSLWSSHAVADTFGSGENAFEIEFATIGDPGNPPDTTGKPSPSGSVGYVYRMGKHEISREMIEKANAEGGLGITLESMNLITGGPRPLMPATGVSWFEAARFVNWLNTSQGFPSAYKFGAQPGDVEYDPKMNIDVWQLGDPGFDAGNPFRNNRAHYFLPSVDEWYKAAFYDPTANDGAGGYWDFATGSNSAPIAVVSGTAAGTAVYMHDGPQGPADITQAGGLSPYGVMALGGNVNEWEETEYDLVNDDGTGVRGVRSGSWVHSFSFSLSSSARNDNDEPEGGVDDLGFRVASIPEPTSLLLGVLSFMALLIIRRP